MPRRISKIDSEFSGYIITSTTYLLDEPTPGIPNWQRLGLTLAEKDQWEAYYDDWTEVYPKYLDPGQRTKAITNQKNNVKANFTEFASPILNRLQPQAALLTALDRTTLNLPVRDTTPTGRGPITGVPVNDIAALGGGTMRFKVRTSEDSSRASKHPLADGVEVRYKIVAPGGGTNFPSPVPGAGTADTTPPTSPDDCPLTFTSSKASFKLVLGAAHSGKKIYGFARWINMINPVNNGEWSAMFQAVIV